MGHDIPKLKSEKSNDLYILATKQPELGQRLYTWALAKGIKVIMHHMATPREVIYQTMAASLVTITIPNKTEGFYLPGIEAMALSDWAIVPDCIASREYSLGRANISSCDLNELACQRAILHSLNKARGWKLFVSKWHGRRLLASYSVMQERENYHEMLGELAETW
jgi:hypothetical protein